MSDDRLLRQVVFGIVEGSNRRWRPSHRPANWPAWSGSDQHSSNKTRVTHLLTQNSRGIRFHTFCLREAFSSRQNSEKSLIPIAGGRGQRTLPRKPIPAVAFSLDLWPFLPPAAVLRVLPRPPRLCPRGMTRLGISQCWQVCQDWLSKI